MKTRIPRIGLIAAVSRNNALGKDNQLLWHLPADLQHFRKITTGHSIIMGRKTWQSIGRPLPNRRNIVVSRNESLALMGAEKAASLTEAIRMTENEAMVFVIGGADLYRQALPLTDYIYLTRIYEDFEGDVFFPELNRLHWRLVYYIRHHADEKNKYEYSFSEYERVV